MKKRGALLFYCQHSRGIGHLTRSLSLAAELGRRFRLVLLSGGKMPGGVSLPANIEVIHLPPVELSLDNQLLSSDRRRSLARTMELRGRRMLEVFEQLQPEVVMTELYPFGRMSFSSEVLPLLEAARAVKRNRPLVICSLRDVMEQSHSAQQELNAIACVVCNHLYDAALIHADPRLARFEETFRSTVKLTTPVRYTGFVVPAGDELPRRNNGSQVIVSAGGGRVGGPLLLAAAEAYARYGIGAGIRMTIAAGPFLPDEEWQALKAAAAGVQGLKVCRWIPGMMNALSQAVASVSQCGYNTALASLRARVPALFVPFVGARDKEQLRRARTIEQLGAARVLEQEQASPRTLATEIRALLDFHPNVLELDMDGATKTARIIETMLRERD
jgi:predicted glycosyltransferase